MTTTLIALILDGLAKLAPPLGVGFAAVTLVRTLKWKRAELASTYLKEFSQNQELVFACRSLDWMGGNLIVPDVLKPLLRNGDCTINHDPAVLEVAVGPYLTVVDATSDPRIQLYRTAIDDLLSWLSVLSNSIEQGLFRAKDLPGLKYWVELVLKRSELADFIDTFNYRVSLVKLGEAFRDVDV